MILIHDNHNIIFANKSYYDFIGTNLNNDPFYIIIPEYKDMVISKNLWIKNTIKDTMIYEFKAINKNNEIKWIESYVKLIEYDKENVILNILVDIEDKKNQENLLQLEVNKRTKQLKLINEELEKFAYAISHDLKSPTRIINGMATISLKEFNDKLPVEIVENLNDIISESNFMQKQIDGLLNLSRASRGNLNKETINI